MAPGGVPSLAPLRTIRELHRRTAAELGMGSREDIEGLLSEVQQLLVGISIMQVSLCRHCQTEMKRMQKTMQTGWRSCMSTGHCRGFWLHSQLGMEHLGRH